MFSPGDVYVLAESGMSDGLQNLEASQDFDGVRSKWESVASTHIIRKSRGKECEGS